jgi:hypothetical protein
MEASAEIPAAPPPPPTGASRYPSNLYAQRQDKYNRWLPLVKWLLALPHYIVLAFLFLGVVLGGIGAFFAVLFTGRYPRGVFDYMVGVYGWAWRVQAYAGLLRDEYPPFSLRPTEPYFAEVQIDYPEEGIARWRPLVQWLLAIPYLFVANLLSFVARALIIVAFFVILFTENFPEGLFNLYVGASRWGLRGYAYATFLTERYPPWDFDELTGPADRRAGG